MEITKEEMKNYLRVDFEDDDSLITSLIADSKKFCMNVLRTDDEGDLDSAAQGRTAVMYCVAYLYEHREEADHHGLTMTLRSLLFGDRKEGF